MHAWHSAYPAMKHSLISFLECGVVVQYQNLAFELVYRYSAPSTCQITRWKFQDTYAEVEAHPSF